MIEEGDTAPPFELPAVREGEIETVALDEYLGEEVIILAFYPADFNPACSDGETDLDDLDLFTMQKDVSILGVSGDSVYSHRAFADEYNLNIPLLADVHGEVAEKYGMAVDDTDAGYLTRRAIVVIDHTETVDYTWVGTDIDDLVDVDEIREAVQGVGSDETAQARYRVGHAHYMEGRRAFTSAMKAFEDREWMMAQGDFNRAYEEFAEAKEEFNTSVRFSEDAEAKKYYERAESKAEALWRASEWLRDSANAFASGEGAKADSMREDAEAPLEEAREIHEPPDPDDFPPEEDPAEKQDDSPADDKSYLDEDDEDVDTSLDLDGAEETVDLEADEPATTEPTSDDATEISQAGSSATEPGTSSTAGPEASPEIGTDSQAAGESPAAGQETAAEAGSGSGEAAEASEIDDSELEKIAAELEEQTEAANKQANSEDESNDDGLVPDEIDAETIDVEDGRESTDTTGNSGDTANVADMEEDEIELELTDPSKGEDRNADSASEDSNDTDGTDEGSESGNQGVPDSL